MSAKDFKIIIVGGGTAGWLSAAFLSQQLPISSGRNIQITLIEASDIPTVGVGEATVPSLRETLAACGISEIDFLRSCGATFKHGIKFVNWRKAPQDAVGESYFHPFGVPLQVGSVSPLRAWSKLDPNIRGNIADLFSVQSEMAETGRAPKHMKDRPYDGALSYAYHLDAGKFAEYLKQRFRAQGVNHIIGKVAKVDVQPDSDNISSLEMEDGTTHSAATHQRHIKHQWIYDLHSPKRRLDMGYRSPKPPRRGTCLQLETYRRHPSQIRTRILPKVR